MHLGSLTALISYMACSSQSTMRCENVIKRAEKLIKTPKLL